jgi:hypothetical protein
MIITQVHLVLGTLKGHSKMCSFVTQHNATDVSSFADCRNFHQSGYQRIELSFLYHVVLDNLALFPIGFSTADHV